MSIAAIILAAGFSRRLGRSKQTLEIGGETLVARAVRTAHEAGLMPVILVVPPDTEFLQGTHEDDCTVVQNREAEEGIASSIRAGVRAAMRMSDLHGVVLMTCDQIGTTAKHLQGLCSDPERLTGSGYAGRSAVPAYFPRRMFAGLLLLQDDTGARELLKQAHCIRGDELALDIDTEEDVVRAKLLFEASGRQPDGGFENT